MKKIIILVLIALAACSDSDGPNKTEARAEAVVAWEKLEKTGQEIACVIYNDPQRGRDYFFEQMVHGSNPVSPEVASAKLDILDEKC